MSRGKKWLRRLFLLGFVVLVTMGLWLPPIITHAVEKDYHFSEVEIDATVLPNGVSGGGGGGGGGTGGGAG